MDFVAELSGFEVLALINEFNSRLRGTYVNNIFSIGDAQILSLRKPREENLWLVASPTMGVWVSEQVAERAETTEFTSKLRAELQRARLSGASSVDLDRVFVLNFGEGEAGRKLVVEMMPPGNILVLDEGGRILAAKAEVRLRTRRLVKGSVYTPPVQKRADPANLGPEDFKELVRTEGTAGKVLGRHVSIPRKYVVEILFRLGLAESSPSTQLVGLEGELVRVLREILEEARSRPRPCLAETPWGDDLFAVIPRGFRAREEASSLSSLCDRLFLESVMAGSVPEASAEDKKREELQATIAKLEAGAQRLKRDASALRDAAAGILQMEDLAQMRETLAVLGVKVVHPPATTAAAASLIYDRAKELEQKAKDSQETAAKLGAKIPKKAPPPTPRRSLPKRKREWYENFRWFYTSKGRLAIGGRDAHSNSILVRRHMQSGDIVYHADLFGSPFFLLKDGESQTEEEVREVAQATVIFSSAWKTGLGTADAYWVSPLQVSTAAPSGEYLPRGSFAISGKKNFVPRNFLELALGLDGRGRLVAAPETSLVNVVAGYVLLRPHKEKASDTAKKVLYELKKIGGAEAQGAISVDDVLRALPAGGGKIVRTKANPGVAEGSPGRQ